VYGGCGYTVVVASELLRRVMHCSNRMHCIYCRGEMVPLWRRLRCHCIGCCTSIVTEWHVHSNVEVAAGFSISSKRLTRVDRLPCGPATVACLLPCSVVDVARRRASPPSVSQFGTTGPSIHPSHTNYTTVCPSSAAAVACRRSRPAPTQLRATAETRGDGLSCRIRTGLECGSVPAQRHCVTSDPDPAAAARNYLLDAVPTRARLHSRATAANNKVL